MTILGHAVKPWMLWVGGGVAALMVFLYLRNRSQGAAQEAPAGDGGGGSFGAGATAGSAPASNSGGGTDYGSQLNQLQLQEEQQRLQQSQQMFDLQYSSAKQETGLRNQFSEGTLQNQIGFANQQLATDTAHERELGKASADYCPAGTSMRLDPNTGQYVCRNKSGGFAFIGQISSAIQNVFSGFTSGVAAAAPGIGAGAAQAAAQYYEGRLFTPGGVQTAPVGGQATNTRFNFPQFTPGIAGGYPGSPVPAGGGRIQYPDQRMSGGPVSTMPIG